jgi:hypothetical protein
VFGDLENQRSSVWRESLRHYVVVANELWRDVRLTQESSRR